MDRKKAIASLKAEIAELVVAQRKDKAELRKPHDDCTQGVITPAIRAQWDTGKREIRITGLLNLYNFLRNRTYQHLYRNDHKRREATEVFEKTLKKLEELYPDVMIAA